MSQTTVTALPVSQSSNPDHQVLHAVTIKRNGTEFVAVDCSCGASSPLCQSAGLAREWWREHVGLPRRQVDRASAYAGD